MRAMTMVTATRQDMMYCPGCSHGTVLETIGAGLERLGLKPEQVCLVTDIGCIGTADKYFECHTFHGLHGRSLTYAEGIKRRCPELTVIVLIGDGGCGIGTAHLVHTARRGVGIKVFVCNNFNFGMTGGQHSPTTPCGATTATTPGGIGDPPLDLCQLAIASGAAFVARCTALDRDFGDTIDAALRSPGFALLDIWEQCTAYYVPQNKLTKLAMEQLARDLRMTMGVLRNEPPPHQPSRLPVLSAADGDEISTPSQRTSGEPMPPDSRLKEFAAGWPDRGEIELAGSAGERIRSAAGVIGEMLVAAGMHVAQHDDYPITVRKGYSLATLSVSAKPIRCAGGESPDLVIIQSEDGLRRIGKLTELSPSALLVIGDQLPCPATPARVLPVALSPLSTKVGRANLALALLSFGIVRRGWTTPQRLLAAAEASVTGRFRNESLQAITAGATLTANEQPLVGQR